MKHPSIDAPNHCPQCKSKNIAVIDHFDNLCIPVLCKDCGVEWFEHYTYTYREIIGEEFL
jgi:predicted Zn-ribbon and HTH transcriptional regulator